MKIIFHSVYEYLLEGRITKFYLEKTFFQIQAYLFSDFNDNVCIECVMTWKGAGKIFTSFCNENKHADTIQKKGSWSEFILFHSHPND